jgi:hypothetical protein
MGASKSCNLCQALKRIAFKVERPSHYLFKYSCRMLTVNNTIKDIEGTPEWCPLLVEGGKEDGKS